MEVAIADHCLVGHGYQRVVVGGVQLDRDGVTSGRDILTQRPMDLRYNSEREGVLYGSRPSGLEETASRQQLPDVIGCRCLPKDSFGSCHCRMQDRRVGGGCLHRERRCDIRSFGCLFSSSNNQRRVADGNSVG